LLERQARERLPEMKAVEDALVVLEMQVQGKREVVAGRL
jgi:hypothetical protein